MWGGGGGGMTDNFHQLSHFAALHFNSLSINYYQLGHQDINLLKS